LYYYFWFFLLAIAIVWNTFAVVEVVTDREEVMEDTGIVVGVGDGGLLIGGLLSGMTMNKTET
jgi:hypothetical protein